MRASMDGRSDSPRRPGGEIAILIRHCNEEAPIGKVARDVQDIQPDYTVYAYDNNFRDDTRAATHALRAVVRAVPLQGKGHVVRHMFADIEADISVLVDGDSTCDPFAISDGTDRLVNQNFDIVTNDQSYEAGDVCRRGPRHLCTGTLTD